jgi:hypothetical protein
MLIRTITPIMTKLVLVQGFKIIRAEEEGPGGALFGAAVGFTVGVDVACGVGSASVGVAVVVGVSLAEAVGALVSAQQSKIIMLKLEHVTVLGNEKSRIVFASAQVSPRGLEEGSIVALSSMGPPLQARHESSMFYRFHDVKNLSEFGDVEGDGILAGESITYHIGAAKSSIVKIRTCCFPSFVTSTRRDQVQIGFDFSTAWTNTREKREIRN